MRIVPGVGRGHMLAHPVVASVRGARSTRGGRVIIVAVMAAALCKAAPAMADQQVEAERMHVPRTAGHVVRDRSASAHRAVSLTGPGSITARLGVQAPSRLRIVARGAACAGAPRLAAAIDGRRVLSRRVGRRWSAVAVPAAVTAAGHRVSLRLANPHRGRHCRRALRIDRLLFASLPSGAPGSAPAPAPPAPGADARWWVPAPRTTWQWQLTTPVDQSVDAQMFDIDLLDNAASVVAALHARGRRVVCYLDAGTFEPGRPDSAAYPAVVKGNALPDWPGEEWLDIRRLDILAPILAARLDLCRQKGFDGVEADNVDAHTNNTGFPLTAADQLRFNRFLADAAHARGLSIGLKNDLEQAAALEPSFDWAMNEQCFEASECGALQPFVRAGKAVFVAEYDLDVASFCPQAQAAGFMAMRKRLALDAWRQTCW